MAIMTVRRFEYKVLKARLKPEDTIIILSCDNCAKRSDGLGGEQGLKSLADKLVADGFVVIHKVLLQAACSRKHLKACFDGDTFQKLVAEADVIIPLSCRTGIEMVREFLPDLNILHVTKTLGKGKSTLEGGARLMKPFEGVGIEVDDLEGIPLREAARRLSLFHGSF
jgi:hypothetical protein